MIPNLVSVALLARALCHQLNHPSPGLRRALLASLGLLVLFLWWNAVRRGMAGSSSQLDNFVQFGRDLYLEQVNVYDAYEQENTITKYPPFFGLLFTPLAVVPMAIAASLWFWLNLVLSVIATRLGLELVAGGSAAERRPPTWIPFLLASPVIISNLETSQVNIVIVTLLLWALLLHRRGRAWHGGFILGIATALKLTPGIFLPYFLLKRQWRMVAGASLGLFLAWFVVPALLLGWPVYPYVLAAWLEKLTPFLADGALAEGLGGFRHTNQSLSAVLHRTLARIPADAGRGDFYVNVVALSPEAVRTLVRFLDLAVVSGLVWICRPRSEDLQPLETGFEYAIVMIGALLLSPISWINHYVALLFPYIVAVQYLATRSDEQPQRTWMLAATAISFGLLLTSVSFRLQAFSLPFLGAVVLAGGLVGTLLQERRAGLMIESLDP